MLKVFQNIPSIDNKYYSLPEVEENLKCSLGIEFPFSMPISEV